MLGEGIADGSHEGWRPPGADRWRETAVARAEQILRNRLRLFDIESYDYGEEIDWNFEPKARVRAPQVFAQALDYRDYSVVGDCKFVWEPNRHQHLVVLGRAFRLTGDTRYADKVLEQIESWIEQCPFGIGINWRSPLELAIRLINWVWAFELIRPSGVLTRDRWERILPVVWRHLWDISRKYSRYSSANNHLIGEAAGVFIASTYFDYLRGAEAWQRQSAAILNEQIETQTYPDGVHREQAVGYHLFVMELFLLAGLVACRAGNDFPAAYWRRLERMFNFVAALAEGGGRIPRWGDCDDGYVLDLGGASDDAETWMTVGACLFGRADFRSSSSGFTEPAYWLCGRTGFDRYEAIPTDHDKVKIGPRAFANAGCYLLQCGSRGDSDRISVSFDCGELGFGSIAAHGHADALSITLRAFGEDVFVDTGTYDYFTYPDWRASFRGTRAHNTVVVDDRDQSEMLGPFLWGRRARARCTRWEPSADGGTVAGEHDGYTALNDGVIHRRTVSLLGTERRVTVVDEVSSRGRHTAVFFLHLAESCRLMPESGNIFRILLGVHKITIRLDSCFNVELFHGNEEQRLGWVSRRYHQRTPTTTVVGRFDWSGDARTVCEFLLG